MLQLELVKALRIEVSHYLQGITRSLSGCASTACTSGVEASALCNPSTSAAPVSQAWPLSPSTPSTRMGQPCSSLRDAPVPLQSTLNSRDMGPNLLDFNLMPWGARAYAKAARPAKKEAEGPPKRFRRSYTRLFSCRNDRFRSAFEQIWPTLRLTEAEQQLFKRNSRMFVVETGKAISLKQKFNISRPPPDMSQDAPFSDMERLPTMKPHYSEARSMLFESDLHLDAAGEHPRYLKIRKIRTQFGIRLQNLRKIRLLLGFVRRGYLQKLYEQSQVQPGSNKVWKLVCAMEGRLGMFALRMGLAHDILAANVTLRDRIYLNGTPPALKQAYFMQPGDVVSPAPDAMPAYKEHLGREMGTMMQDVHRAFMK